MASPFAVIALACLAALLIGIQRLWLAAQAERRLLVEERRAQARWLREHGHPGAMPAHLITSPKDPLLVDPALLRDA
jgi:hypothetical protein